MNFTTKCVHTLRGPDEPECNNASKWQIDCILLEHLLLQLFYKSMSVKNIFPHNAQASVCSTLPLHNTSGNSKESALIDFIGIRG